MINRSGNGTSLVFIMGGGYRIRLIFNGIKKNGEKDITRRFTLYGRCEIDGIEAAGAELLVGALFPLAEPVPGPVLAPEVRAAVGERNV